MFAAEPLAEIEMEIRKVRAQLEESAIQIGAQQSKYASLSEEVSALPEIEESLKAFAGEKSEDGDSINQEHSSKALRDRETLAVKALQEHLQEYSEALGTWVGALAQQVHACLDEEMFDGPNGVRFKELSATLKERSQRADRHVLKARDEVAEVSKGLAEFWSALARVHKEQELTFRELIEG